MTRGQKRLYKGVGLEPAERVTDTPRLCERFEQPVCFRADRLPTTYKCGKCREVQPTRRNQTQLRCAACGAFHGLIVGRTG